MFKGRSICLLLCLALMLSLFAACVPKLSQTELPAAPSEAPVDLPLLVSQRAELIDWNTLEGQMPKVSEVKAVNASAESRAALKELLDSFEADKLELMLVGEAHMPDGFSLPLTAEDVAMLLGNIQKMQLTLPHPTNLLNPMIGEGRMVYLKQGETSCVLTEGGFFTIWDSSTSTNTKQLFEWEQNEVFFEHIYSILSLSHNRSAEVAMMQSNQLPQHIGESRFATKEDLEHYRETMRTLRASDITKLYHGAHGYEGKQRALEPYAAEGLLDCLWSAEKLSVFDAPKNPATGGSEFLYLEWKGQPLSLSWDGFWLTVQLPGESEALIFDGSAVAAEWNNAFSQLIAYEDELLPKPVLPTEEKPWWVRTFSAGDTRIYTNRLYLHHDIQKLSYSLLSEYDAVASLLANAVEERELGKPWKEELSLQFILGNDDKYTLKLFEQGVELTYSHWKLEEKTTVRLLLDPQKYAALKQRIEIALSEGKETTALWLSMANKGRVQAVSISDPKGKKIAYSADNRFDLLHILGEPAMRHIYVTGTGSLVDKAAIPANAYTILVDFNNGIRYTVTVGEQKLHIASSDVTVAVEYTLVDAAKSHNHLTLLVDEQVNPTVPSYDWSFTPNPPFVSAPVENPSTAKPVIYLYPEQPVDCTVTVDYDCFTYTYPTYHDGWNVTAYPDGRLINRADNSEHYYLFWEGNKQINWRFDSGFVVKGGDTERFLLQKLAYMGLTPREYNDFITYWVPRMQHNAYNLITFATDQYEELAPLTVTPTPDSVLRVHMVYKAVDAPADIPEQVLSPFTRKGFTVVEWGGTVTQ